jgi:Uma2 family endonuclease
MSTSAQKRKAGDRGRVPYRFTAKQVMKMIRAGIIADDEDVELWDGILYKMTKGELHNQIVMLTAKALDRVIDPAAYHVREEKSNSDGRYSLPEPDVTVQRGKLGVLKPRPPKLEHVALVVEVDYSTARSDRIVKYSRYAERRIPVYWIIKAKQRIVLVFDMPEGVGAEAHYARSQRYSGDAEIPIVIDGREVGRVVASSLFPVAESS